MQMWSQLMREKITGSWDRIFQHFSANLNARYLWFSADIKAEFINLRARGDIKVEVDIGGIAAPAAKPSWPAPTSNSSRPFTVAMTAWPMSGRSTSASGSWKRCARPLWPRLRAGQLAAAWQLPRSCDFRIATPASRFGVPIAKTLGNCLSVANLARLSAVFGMPRVRRMLMLAEVLVPEEALNCGFLLQISEAGEIEAVLARLCERLGTLAPVTQNVSKEGLRRLVSQNSPADEDFIRRCYGSTDFREGVDAFMSKRPPAWSGE